MNHLSLKFRTLEELGEPELAIFCEQALACEPGYRGDELMACALGGDAGFRRYYRLNGEPSLLAVNAPPETEDTRQFCAVNRWFAQHAIRVPDVVAVDEGAGFLLIEDLGERQLLDDLGEHSVHGYYAEALNMLLHMHAQTPDEAVFGVYGEDKLREEIDLFAPWFCQRLLGLTLSQSEIGILNELSRCLVHSALEQKPVVVHRDFHSRNLMILADGSLATIDFQDALIGPVSYDLVSLLKDCYISWPEEQVERWVLVYAATARDAGLISASSAEVFLHHFHWMGLQRHLKVLGIFARLFLRDGKSSYLNDLPRVMRYVSTVLARYQEFDGFRTFFDARVVPAAKKQPWYRQ